MKNKKAFLYIMISICVILIYLILDYFNILSDITKNLNFNTLGILVNAIMLLLVFIITYSLVNKKTFEHEEEEKNNKMNMLEILLKNAYRDCSDTLKILQNDEIIRKYIIPKMNFNSLKDPILENLKSNPFKNEKYIIELFSAGITNKTIMKKYFEIKDLYQKYVNMRITFFDINDYHDTPEQEELANQLNTEKDILQSKIDLELRK